MRDPYEPFRLGMDRWDRPVYVRLMRATLAGRVRELERAMRRLVRSIL